MNEWMVGKRIYVSDWMNGCMDDINKEHMHLNERMYTWIRRMDGWNKEYIWEKQIHLVFYPWNCLDAWMNGLERIYVSDWMNGCMDDINKEHMHLNERMNKWIRRMDGWNKEYIWEKQIYLVCYPCLMLFGCLNEWMFGSKNHILYWEFEFVDGCLFIKPNNSTCK